MPQVVAGAVVSGFAAGSGFTLAGGLTLGFSYGAFATSLVLGGLSMALAPSAPSAPRQIPKGITRQIRQPVTTRKIVYGEARVSGPMVYVAQSGENTYIHIILALAGHEVAEIGEVWLNDTSITDDMMDGSGNVTSGTFDGLARIKKHLGTTSQTADSDLVSEVTEWTTAHRLRGVAYVYARLKWDRNKFPSGVPNISAWTKGKKVSDPRDSGWDLSTASYDSVSFDVSGEDASPTGIAFSRDGFSMYMIGDTGDTIEQYPLTTAWDLSSAGASTYSLNVSGEDTSPQDIAFSQDGTKLYMVGGTNDSVYQYTLSTAWSLSTASYDSVSLDVSTEDGTPLGFCFNFTGTKLYMVGTVTDTIYQYPLGTAWDISTAGSSDASLVVSGQDTDPVGLYMRQDGTKMYMVGATNGAVYQYTLTTGDDLGTASYDSVSKVVTSEDTLPMGIFFKTDGTKMYMVGQTGDNVYQYSLSETGAAVWSPNMALQVNDYISWEMYGYGAAADEVDETTTIASANICDEIVEMQNEDHSVTSVDASDDTITIDGDVLQLHTGDRVWILSTGTVPGGLTTATDYYAVPYQRKGTPRVKLATSLENAYAGTTIDITSSGSGTITVRKNGEPRYAGGGVLDTSDTPKVNIEKMLPTMAGRAIYSDKWYVQAGAYQTPTITLTEDDFIGPITMPTRMSRAERYNTVKGLYSPPHESGLEADFPAYTNSTYVTNDNGKEVSVDLNQPFTQRPQHARRCAKIELERARQEIVLTVEVRIKQGMLLRAGDVVMLTFDKYGWSSKPFEVTSWGLNYREGEGDSGGVPVCPMTLRETASTVFDWDNGDEVTVDPAPNTNLPDPFTVTVVTGFSLGAILIDTQAGDKIYNTVATWDEHTNQFVVEGGQYEVSYKRTTDSTYVSAGVVDGGTTELGIAALQPDILYDVQIVAYNNLGVASSPTTINNYQVGTTAVTDTEDWENETLARSGDDWETDTLTSEDWET